MLLTGYIDVGVKEGAKLLVGGRTFSGKDAGTECIHGFWMGDTLFDHVTSESNGKGTEFVISTDKYGADSY